MDALPVDVMENAHYFLKCPELTIQSEDFPFESFECDEIASETLDIAFPTDLLLGKQAEFLFEAWLKQSPRYKILSANLQVQGERTTLGELDYLVMDSQSGKVLHIELACKFYVYDDTLGKTATKKWIGPNRKDRLLDKLKKLKNRQFPLLHKKETKSVLEQLKVEVTKIEQRYCLKAFLFLPNNFNLTQIPEAYQKRIAGFYLSFESFEAINCANALYFSPEKKQWLYPPTQLEGWVSFSELKPKIETELSRKQSRLVYKKTGEHIEKFFIVWW